MERLTKRVGVDEAVPICDFDICVPFQRAGKCKTGTQNFPFGMWERHCNDTCILGRMIDRLAAYEDTGLTPGEVASLQKKLQYAQEERDVVTKRMIEFDTANAQGRLVVLPSKPGDTVYVVGEGKIMECTADVFAIESSGACAHVYFECDDDCDGCPFNSWHQDPCGEYSCYGEYGDGTIDLSDFGKTVFLTREDAEAKLREDNNG